MTDEEARLTLARLAKEARDRFGEDRKAAAARIGVAYNTLSDLERTGRLPARTTAGAMERGYGLRSGSLKAVWDNRRQLQLGEPELDILLDPHARPVLAGPTSLMPVAPVTRASELSDAELMTELNFRFLMRDMRDS